MASSSSMHFLFISLLIALLSVTVSAGRPCKALYIASDYSFVAVVTETTPAETILTRRPLFPQLHRVPQESSASSVASYYSLSFDEGLKDILSVVLGLSLLVACGVFTAASLYVIWAVLTWSSASGEKSDEDDDDIAKLKKLGYVKIPAVKS